MSTEDPLLGEDETLAAMERYGGSFVSTLACLMRVADEDNQRRLRAAFADYFSEYREIAMLRRKQKVDQS